MNVFAVAFAGNRRFFLKDTGKGTIDWGQASLIATIPVTKHIKDEFDPAGDSQLFENSVDVVPDGMFLNLKPLSNFAVLQAIGDEANPHQIALGKRLMVLVSTYLSWPRDS